MSEVFDLGRSVQAQDPVLARVRRELGERRKRGHAMGSVYPSCGAPGVVPPPGTTA